MNKQFNLKQILASLLIGAALVLTGWAANLIRTKETPPLAGTRGITAQVATSSRLTLVAETVQTLIATSTCAARIITTKASPILLTFSERVNNLPTATYGHLQAASTTVSYFSEDYGCGKVKALTADGLGSVISISETQ